MTVLLRCALEVAVPLWIERVRDWSEAERARRRAVCSQAVAKHGDVILYRERGKTADAFNRLAEGLALLAFVPGGVTLGDLHFEVVPGSSNPSAAVPA